MNNQIILTLQRKLEDLNAYGEVQAETQRNALKEELQFYVLNFIYHHTEYSRWIMYGGSALRICHGLDRMSVDLDFEVGQPVSDTFLDTLKDEVQNYFRETYNVGSELLTVKITKNRGITLQFQIGDELKINHPSKQVHVKIDLNHFSAPKTVTERRPLNRDQLSFVINTYNMSALMASKISAIFLRGTRGVGDALYGEKGRDIYDLLWYMTKHIIPDLDYLIAKKIDVTDVRALFDKLTIRMNSVNDINLRQDLTPLFVNQIFIENWLKNWRESYLHLLEEYTIDKVSILKNVTVYKDFHNNIFSFIYQYITEKGTLVRIIYSLSDYWIEFHEGNLLIVIDEKIKNIIAFDGNGSSSRQLPEEKLLQYATLFYQKTENYFQKTNHIILGDTINTKVIRMTADNLNQKEQIVLNKSALLSCELDDLLQ